MDKRTRLLTEVPSRLAEFLQSLQERQKWIRPRRNLEVDDIVIVKDDNIPRNQWQLARVAEVHKDEDGLVRKVNLAIGDPFLSNEGKRVRQMSFLQRPIQKLVLLLPHKMNGRPGIPDEEPYI